MVTVIRVSRVDSNATQEETSMQQLRIAAATPIRLVSEADLARFGRTAYTKPKAGSENTFRPIGCRVILVRTLAQ